MTPRRLLRPAIAVALAGSMLAVPSRHADSRGLVEVAGPAVVDPSRAIVGEWSTRVAMPTKPAHAALLPNGKLIVWVVGSTKYTSTWVYDPAAGTSVRVTAPGANLMCPGLVQLPDGRLFVAGGQGSGGGSQGLRTTLFFDPATNKWSKGPMMAARRWYPSLAVLPNGEVLILGGGPVIPEVLQTDGRLRRLTTAPLALAKRYPFIEVGSNGKVGFYGHSPVLRELDTSGTGAWTTFGDRDDVERVYGSYAMYDIDKVLVAGGGESRATPTNTAVVVERVGDELVATPTASLATARRQLNLTILADGTVLATGGQNGTTEQVDVKKGVRTPELWDPATGQWTSMAPAERSRQYHSTALLLPDARVFTTGGGQCASCDRQRYNERNAEIFSPPYLFAPDGSLAVRPVITSFPAVATPGGSYPVSVTAAGVTKMALVKLGSNTHSVDLGQRYVPLTVASQGGWQYEITLPGSPGALPPGYYMLFAIDGAGVPSVAQMVRVQ